MRDASGKRLDSFNVVGIPATRTAVAPLTAPNASTTLGADIDYNIRTIMVFPFTTKRWRLKFRNRNLSSAGALAGTATITGIAHGVPTRPTTTSSGQRWIGNCSTISQVSSSPIAIANDGTFAYSPWFAAEADQFQNGAEKVISLGITAPSGATLANGNSYQWARMAGANTVAASTVASPSIGGNVSYLDISIEYEMDAAVKIIVLAGDSNSISYVEAEPSPLATYANGGSLPSEAWPNVASMMGGFAVINLAVGGGTQEGFAPSSPSHIPALWDRVPAGVKADAAIVALGTNNLGVGLSSYATYLADINSKMRTTYEASSIWWATIPPRAYPNGTYTGTGTAICANLSADVAAGATTITVDRQIGTGLTSVGTGMKGEDVTISSITGSGPWTATLSAPIVNAHYINERVGQGDERLRLYKNAHLRLNPDGIRGIYDFEKALEASPGAYRQDDRYVTSGWLHNTRAASSVKANMVVGAGVQPLFA
jgi:hypothetical protein